MTRALRPPGAEELGLLRGLCDPPGPRLAQVSRALDSSGPVFRDLAAERVFLGLLLRVRLQEDLVLDLQLRGRERPLCGRTLRVIFCLLLLAVIWHVWLLYTIPLFFLALGPVFARVRALGPRTFDQLGVRDRSSSRSSRPRAELRVVLVNPLARGNHVPVRADRRVSKPAARAQRLLVRPGRPEGCQSVASAARGRISARKSRTLGHSLRLPSGGAHPPRLLH